MAGQGRGGSPSGFIGRSTARDLHGSRSDSEDKQEYANGHNNSNSLAEEGIPGPSSPFILEENVSPEVLKDLKKSGLSIGDIQARELGGPEKAICRLSSRTEGYVIPYFDSAGSPSSHYRIKVLNANYTNGPKYKQPARSANYIYFPLNFRETLLRHVQARKGASSRIVIITEGEKKAACCCKFGFPTIGLSGVDSWRSRTILLPEGTELYQGDGSESGGGGGGGDDLPRARGKKGSRGILKARLPASGANPPELITLASGFGDLIDLITQYGLQPVIIFDSDRAGTVKAEVQRAATMLAYELVFLGIHANRIKQVVLPAISQTESKSGIDDFLMDRGPEDLNNLISKRLNDPKAFPRHPNPKGFISAQMQGRMSRKQMQQIAAMILTELDAAGTRMLDRTTEIPYYYDRDSAHLIEAQLLSRQGVPYHEQRIGKLLYQRYGISANDSKVLGWLASQFTGEEPIQDVTPRRILCLITEKEDAINPLGIAYQASDSQFFAISPDPDSPLELLTNGSKGILFEQSQVEALDTELVLDHFDHILSEALETNKLKPWWAEVIRESTIGLGEHDIVEELSEEDVDRHNSQQEQDQKDLEGETDEGIPISAAGKEMRNYATLLYYISPFLLRWRGLQLPLELTVGPAGSGKSSLYNLRLSILTGRPKLRNIPTDIRDWQSSLAHAGGLHVTDNVHFMNKELQQRVSDELCRITTEPNPEITMRKYFTNTDEMSVPVRCTFAFTSIRAPFRNEDLIQRSVTFKTAFVDREPEGDWVDEKLQERGGREAWVAHHLVFLHLFLKQAWNPDFRTQHRLAHLEQCLTIASKVLDIQSLPDEVFKGPKPITYSTDIGDPDSNGNGKTESIGLGNTLFRNQVNQMQESDPILQAIKEFVLEKFPDVVQGQYPLSPRFGAADIAEWAGMKEAYMDMDILLSARRLGRYMQEHTSTLAQILRVRQSGTYGNRLVYKVYAPKSSEGHKFKLNKPKDGN